MGIEPTLPAWKAEVLPLNYTRTTDDQMPHSNRPRRWWRGQDSNLRRRSRQIYSLIPLATRKPLPIYSLQNTKTRRTALKLH